VQSEDVKLKQVIEIPPDVRRLFKHLEYFRDQHALEFRYLESYLVLDKSQFLTELESISRFFTVDHLLNNPLKMGTEDLSLHVHVSGPGATDKYAKLWNNKILLDHIQAGFKKELFEGAFGYAEKVYGEKGFVRNVGQNHVELRNLSVPPQEALSLDIEDLEKSIINTLKSKTIYGTSTFEVVAKLSPEALVNITEITPRWLQEVPIDVLSLYFKKSHLHPRHLTKLIYYLKANSKELNLDTKSKLKLLTDHGLSFYENPINQHAGDSKALYDFIHNVDYDEETIVRLLKIGNKKFSSRDRERIEYIKSIYQLAAKNNITITKESFLKFDKKNCNTVSNILSSLVDTPR
jgi:hypothetical protein